MNKFFIHNVISDIKEVSVFIAKAIFITAALIAPFYLVHLIESHSNYANDKDDKQTGL